MTFKISKAKGSFFFTGILLLLYPAVFIASIMSLAAEENYQSSVISSVVSRAFFWGSLAYPVVYFVCLFAYKKTKKTIWYKNIFKYLILLTTLLITWMLLGE